MVGVQVTWSPEQQAALKGFVAQVPPPYFNMHNPMHTQISRMARSYAHSCGWVVVIRAGGARQRHVPGGEWRHTVLSWSLSGNGSQRIPGD